MSLSANVAVGKCRDRQNFSRQMSRPAEFHSANVATGKCRDRQMSRSAKVRPAKVRPAKVRPARCRPALGRLQQQQTKRLNSNSMNLKHLAKKTNGCTLRTLSLIISSFGKGSSSSLFHRVRQFPDSNSLFYDLWRNSWQKRRKLAILVGVKKRSDDLNYTYISTTKYYRTVRTST